MSRRFLMPFTSPFALVCLALALFACFSFLRSAQAAGTISGRVFHDFNANGAIDNANELGIAGVTVTVYDLDDTPLLNTLSDANGDYSLTIAADGPYRVEFSTLPTGYVSSPIGPQSGSTIQFVPDGGSNSVNLGLNYPSDYCQDNPELALTCFVVGDQSNALPVVATLPYTLTGSTATSQATSDQVGSVWGIAYQPSSRSLFTSAYTRRHADYGPGGPGQIYKIASDGTVTPFVQLVAGDDLHPTSANGTPCTVPGRADYSPTQVGATRDCYFHDPYLFDPVGKSGIGDIDLYQALDNPANDMLFAINLFDRQLYQISGLNSGSPAATGFALPTTLPGASQACPVNDVRPFSVAFWRGTGYVGLVCSSETAKNNTQLFAYVYQFDPLSVSFGAAPLVEFPLTYARGAASTGLSASWRAWSNNAGNLPTNSFNGTTTAYPQPMLSDLIVDSKGDLTIGLRDRYGDQGANGLGNTTASNGTNYNYISAGDTLKACLSGGVFALESNAVCGGITSVGYPGPPGPDTLQAAPQGPGGQEFYYEDAFHNAANDAVDRFEEVTQGGLAYHAGRNEVTSNSFNPIQGNDQAGGLRRFNVGDGTLSDAFEFYTGGAPSYFGRAGGIGDVELLCEQAPIELGNRIWNDLNRNGRQDPNEPGLANIAVGLYNNAGTLIATTQSDSNGIYAFNAANVAAGIQTNTNYSIRIDLSQAALTDLRASPSDFNGIAGDLYDSDGDPNLFAGFQSVAVQTAGPGATNHSSDFGFYETLTIGDLIWEDSNNNGLFDTGESGIANLTVNLYSDNDSNNLPDGAAIATTTSSSAGLYRFAGLLPGRYLVEVVPPAGYVSSTGTNGSASGPFEPAPSADNNTNNDDNGTSNGTSIWSSVVSLALADEPINDGDSNANTNLSVDFGLFRPANISGQVWHDQDGDGVQTPGEPGVAGVLATLFDAANNPIATATSDPSGLVNFGYLIAGSYTVGFSGLPSELPDFTPANGGGDNIDSDVDPATGRSDPITLVAGASVNSLGVGLIERRPTAIDLISFKAFPSRDGVQVEWVTGSERETWGFHLLRSSDALRSNAVRITPELILGQGRASQGANYAWLDSTAQAGVEYYYWLEEHELDGGLRYYGPVKVQDQSLQNEHRLFLPLIHRSSQP
jgi:hypothetical protein